MSIKVMTLVWDGSQHKGSELLLLLALADFAHDDGGGIYPSNATLCAKVRMVERSVRYILRKLEESGELVAEGKHPSGTTRYRIDLSTLGGQSLPGQLLPGQNDAGRGAKSAPPGGQPVAPDPSLIRQEPSGDGPSLDAAARWAISASKAKRPGRRS